MPIKKAPLEPVGGSPIHKSKELPDDLVRFSFRHLQLDNPKFSLPGVERLETYLPQLLDRLKAISGMRISEFRTNKSHSLKAHTHDWCRTSEPHGYCHLSSQLQSCEPWQFCLSANEHGRIHGLLIDSVFYVVWVDPDHALYP